ncbi:MAG TPA: YeeE/YedE family protein [Acidiferrobacterales bacterium]|jgi:uncharacterized membrane protein YedE/YeeE
MELSTLHTVTLWGFFVAVLFGAVAFKTNFCTMGAVSDWVNMGDTGRLRAWFMAIGVAILASQFMQYRGLIDLNDSIYLTANFGWLGHALGGLLFGIGMTLGAGCGQRTLVRVGGGNLKSLVVMLVMAITAYMTLRGLLALVRINYIEVTNVDLAARGLADQGIATSIALWFGLENARLVEAVTAGVIGLALVVWALSSTDYRKSFDNLLAGISIGLFVSAAWYLTGVLGHDDFEPVPLESYTFVAPVADSLNYLMTYTGATIKFGIAAVGGVIVGAFLYALLSGRFRIETFTSRQDMVNHIGGGVLMGFGGVIALGCTIGQGVTGMSTLAWGSLITLATIIFGSAMTMKVQYYMLDEQSFLRALLSGLADFRLFPRGKTA